MRLKLLSPAPPPGCVAEMQLSMASACESLSLNADSLVASTSAATQAASRLGVEPRNDVLWPEINTRPIN